MANINENGLTAINDRITAGLSTAVAILYQKPPVAAPFAMLSASSGEVLCQFTSGIRFDVHTGARVTLSNQGGSNNFATNMFIVEVAGQPLKFKLTVASNPSGASGNAIGGTLGANATIQEKPLSVDLDSLSTLVKYEVNSAGMSRQTSSFNSSVLEGTVGSKTARSATSTLSYPNMSGTGIQISHVLTLVGGNSSYADTTATYYNLSPTTVTFMAPLDAITIAVNQTVANL